LPALPAWIRPTTDSQASLACAGAEAHPMAPETRRPLEIRGSPSAHSTRPLPLRL